MFGNGPCSRPWRSEGGRPNGAGSETDVVAIDIILPRDDVRRWQEILVERLSQAGHDTAVRFEEPGGKTPWAVDRILAFEAILGRGGADALSARVTAMPSGERSRSPDVTIDLTGNGRATTSPTLRVTFDGSPCVSAALRTLAKGELPRLGVDLDGNPIEGACLDVWQSSSEGAYDVQDPDQPDMNLRGLFTTGKDGRYYFRTVRPSSYPVPTDGPVGGMLTALGRHPMRPAHIHFIVGAPGFEPVTTHVFVAGDPYLDSDAVFGVKSSLVEPFVETDDSARASELGLANPFYVAEHDFVLARQAEAD